MPGGSLFSAENKQHSAAASILNTALFRERRRIKDCRGRRQLQFIQGDIWDHNSGPKNTLTSSAC